MKRIPTVAQTATLICSGPSSAAPSQQRRAVNTSSGEVTDTFLTGGNSDRYRVVGGSTAAVERKAERPLRRYFSAAPLRSPFSKRRGEGAEGEGDTAGSGGAQQQKKTFFRGDGGIEGSLTGAMGSSVPLAFEMATRDGSLRDDSYYAYLRPINAQTPLATNQQRLSQRARPAPAAARGRHDPVLDRGVDPANVFLSAEAEAEYAHSKLAIEGAKGSSDVGSLLESANKAWEALLAADGGMVGDDAVRRIEGSSAGAQRAITDGSEGEDMSSFDDGGEAGVDIGSSSPAEGQQQEEEAVEQQQRQRHQSVLLSPFGETMIPSDKAGAYSGREAEYAYMTAFKQHTAPTYAAVAMSPVALASQRSERAMLDVTLSPMPIAAKRRVLGQLAAGAFEKGLMLRASSVETVIGFLAQTTKADRIAAVMAATALPPGSTAASLSLGDAAEGLTPRQLRQAASQKALTITIPNPSQSLITSLYFHLKGTHAAPTPLIIQSVMRVLHQAVLALPTSADGTVGSSQIEGGADASTPHRLASDSPFQKRSREAYSLFNTAHRLLLDCDKYHVLPTRTTLTHYFALCAHFGDMDAAVRRLIDVQESLAISPNAAMFEAVLRGLVKCGLVDEAVGLLARITETQMTVQLLNASMEVLLLSADPQACHAAYSSIQNANGQRSASVIPNADTFSLLLLSCEKMDDWSVAPKLLQHMQEYGVRGDANCLNLMLKGLLKNNLGAYASQLQQTMVYKNVQVWPALDEAVREVNAARRLALASAARPASASSAAAAQRSVEGSEPSSASSQAGEEESDASSSRKPLTNVLLSEISEKGYTLMVARATLRADDADDDDDKEDAAGAADDDIEEEGDEDEEEEEEENEVGAVGANASAYASAGQKDPFVVPSTDEDDALDLTKAFGDGFGDEEIVVKTTTAAEAPAKKRKPKQLKKKENAEERLNSSRAAEIASAEEMAAIVADTPFWDLDEDGELSALGVDGDEEEVNTYEAEAPEDTSAPHYAARAGAGLPGDDSSSHGASNSDSGYENKKESRKRPYDDSPEALFTAMRRKNPRAFVIPRDQRHLEEIMRRRQGHTIDPMYLLTFVERRGVTLSAEQSRSPAALLRKAHKLIFGTTGIQHGDRTERDEWRARKASGGHTASKGQMDAIARSMFEGRPSSGGKGAGGRGRGSSFRR